MEIENQIHELEKQIDFLIDMQQDADKRLHGNEGAHVNGGWHVFKDEINQAREQLRKLKQIYKKNN